QLAQTTGNTHGLHVLGQLARHETAQAGKCVDHGLLAAHEVGGTGVGPKFTLAAEPGHDDSGQEPQHDVHHDGGDHVANARSGVVVTATAQEGIDRIADHAAEEHHKGVHDTLHQRHGDHVAIGHVGDFVANHGLNLFFGHALE